MDPHNSQKQPVEKTRAARQDSAGDDTNKLDLRNEIQEEYRTHPVPWPAWVFQFIHLPENSQILELGSGTGTFWQENRDRVSPGWKVLLTDESEAMVRQARENLHGVGVHSRFLDVNGQALPFRDERFDAVLAIGLLDLVPNLDQSLREIRRVLRPGGQLIATAGGKGHLSELEDLLRPFLPDEVVERLGGQEDRFGMENGERLLAPYFDPVTRHDYNDRLVFTELSPILNYILSEQEIVWSMALDRLGEFAQDVKKKLARSGQITVTVHKGVFEGRKKVD